MGALSQFEMASLGHIKRLAFNLTFFKNME
jgi:hypothetical protein